ncbi:MAG: DUF5667 domain-containing protein [Patescibacteria group bacterium]
MKMLKRQLKLIKNYDDLVNPDPFWVKRNREVLMRQVRNTIREDARIPEWRTTVNEHLYFFKSFHVFSHFKPALTALLVALLATGGWIASVSATFNTVPGDRLWGVKRAAQRTEVLVKSIGASEQKKAQLQLDLAKSRTQEIKKTVENRATVKSPEERKKTTADLNTAVNDVKEAVKSAAESVNTQVKTVISIDPTVALKMVKDAAKDTSEITKSLAESVSLVNNVDVSVTKEVIETVKVVNDTSLTTMAAVITQVAVSSTIDTVSQAKNLINDKLVEMIHINEEIRQDVLDAKDSFVSSTLNADKLLNNNGGKKERSDTDKDNSKSVFVSTTLGTTVNASSTLSATPAVIVTSTAALFKEAEQKTQVIQDSAGEIQKIIDNGDFQEAVSKLKSMNEASGTVQQILVDTKTAVNTVEVRK